MFERLDGLATQRVDIQVDGRCVSVAEGDNLAAALLQAGFEPFRTTPVSGSPRQPYCMMGVCFECLAVIDGVPNQQTCLAEVRAGMVIERQVGAREVTCAAPQECEVTADA